MVNQHVYMNMYTVSIALHNFVCYIAFPQLSKLSMQNVDDLQVENKVHWYS